MAALGGALILAACGGGGDDSGTPVAAPKSNPVPNPPTLNCSAAGVAAASTVTGSTGLAASRRRDPVPGIMIRRVSFCAGALAMN